MREYGLELDGHLAREADGLAPFTHGQYDQVLEALREGDVLLVHYEEGLLRPRFQDMVWNAKRRGVWVVFVCHCYDERARGHEHLVDRFVLHRAYEGAAPRSVVIPLACPAFDPGPGARARVRAEMGWTGTVLLTAGFLTAWKRIPETLECLLGQIAWDAHVHVQAPWPFDVPGAGAEREHARMLDVVGRSGGRATYSAEFLSRGRLLELAHAADLGFVFHGKHTGSVSAATKLFVAGRTPLVVSASSHASDMGGGVVRAPCVEDVGAFAATVARLASDRSSREVLRSEAEVEYQRINMAAVAARYARCFESLS